MQAVDLTQKNWWKYLEKDLQELLTEAIFLVQRVKKWENKFHDYAFVVFPAAKAYEGFLKKLFLDMGFISQKDYVGKLFRIGKALNPSLPEKYRDDSWVYDKLVDYCGDENLSDQLWQTWKQSRNLVFHWFPNQKNAINFHEAEKRLEMIINAIDAAFVTCKIESKRK